MPRRRQGHMNNGGGLETSSAATSGTPIEIMAGEERITKHIETSSATSHGGETYSYLHKKFKKIDATPPTTTGIAFSTASASETGNSNPSLEALFKVTGDELQKIKTSVSSNGVEVGDDEKKKGYPCPYCGLFWGKPSVLQKHIRAHTNERPYPCTTCGISFKTKSNLYKHCKTRAHFLKANHHSGHAAEVVGEDEEIDDDEVSSEEQTTSITPPLNTVTSLSVVTTPNTTGTSIYKPKFHSVTLNDVSGRVNECDNIVGTGPEVGDKSPKIATPEFLQQHITNLISKNAAIVDLGSSWSHKYKRQVSVPANIHLAVSEEVKDDETGNSKSLQNPEGSIIKDLLLKTRVVPSNVRLSGGSVELSPLSQQSISSSHLNNNENVNDKSHYTCHQCNIIFKSLENLDAHKRHYCSRLPFISENEALEPNVSTSVSSSSSSAMQPHKPRGRPKGSKNRPKREEQSRVHSKSLSEVGLDEVIANQVTSSSRRNSIALGEGTESIKDILTSVKWANSSDDNDKNSSSSSHDGPILKKHLLQGNCANSLSPLPIKKQRFLSDEPVAWRRKDIFENLSKSQSMRTNSVHLFGGEVEIMDEGNGATKRIVIDSQFYNGEKDIPKLPSDVASSIVANIAKPVHNSGGTVLQVQETTSIRSLKPPVCIPLSLSTTTTTSSLITTVAVSKCVDTPASSSSGGTVSSILARPKSLAIPPASVHSSMMGTTLVSPETPRPNRKYGQCYFNGHYYTYLELKHSTRVYYCCIFRPQPMYLPQITDPKLSMYSVWQTVPPAPDPYGLTPANVIALYNSKTKTGNVVYSTAPRSTCDLTLTHSTYWTFQQQNKKKNTGKEEMKVDQVDEKQKIKAPSAAISPITSTVSVSLPKLSSGEEYTYVRGRGRGKYICHECGIRCKKPSMLKKHVRTHTDVRPYTCKHCNFSFKTKGNLTKHMKSKAHHKKCVELGIVPVPITIDDAQIDEEAVKRQEAIEHQRQQFANDGDTSMDDDDEEEEEEEEEFDEEQHLRFKEGEEEDDEDEEEIAVDEVSTTTSVADGQFEDAIEAYQNTVIKKAHLEQEIVARSLLDLGQPLVTRSLSAERLSETACVAAAKEPNKGATDCDQPMDLSMPHHGSKADMEDDEDEWSYDDSEDIVVDDDVTPSSKSVNPVNSVESVESEKKLEGAAKSWTQSSIATIAVTSLPRQIFDGGGNVSSAHPTPGVKQIYPSGSSAGVLSRPQAINSYMHRSMEDGKCVCTICNKSFSKPSQLRLHFNIHYFERPFRCDSCAISFRTKGHLQKHRRSVSHYNKVNMNMTFGTPTTDNPRPFKCPDCKIAFRIHGHLAKHLRSKMHIMKLECLGKLPFGTYAEIERSGANLNEIDTTDCENSLESLQVMANRLVDKSTSWVGANNTTTRERTISGGSCDDHSDGLPYVAKSGSEEDLSRPVANQRGNGTSYEDISDEEEPIQSPNQLHPPIQPNRNEVLAFRCHLCGKRVKSAKFLQVHMYVDHSDNNNEASSSSSSSDHVVDMDGNGSSATTVAAAASITNAKSAENALEHLLSHARCRPFICSLCDAAFTSIHYLKLHLVTHQQGIVFGCEECGGSFSSVAELDAHMDRRHSSKSSASAANTNTSTATEGVR